MAWNMAYNISVTTHTPQERWSWVNSGVRLLRNRGIRANPNDMHMHKELAWIFLHKVAGFTDDANQYYKRQFAYEWQNVLGRKPVIDPNKRDRESVVQQYVDWIQPIVDAMKPDHSEVEDAANILLAAQAADWGPIQYAGELHDRATYRYYWELLQKAQVTGGGVPQEAQTAFF